MAAFIGALKGIIAKGVGFGASVNMMVTHGFGISDVVIVSGPFTVVAAEVFTAGAVESEVYMAGASKSEVFTAGAAEGEVAV